MSCSANAETHPKICLCQANFPRLPIAEFVAVASAAGATAIDLHPGLSGEPSDAVVAAVRRSGLEVALVSPMPDWYAGTDGGRRPPPALSELLGVAAETGGCIGVPSPLYSRGEEPPSQAAMVRALEGIHDEAAGHGVGVAFEPVGRSVMRPGARGAIGSLDAARALLGSSHLPISLVADSYCLASAGVDLLEPWSTEDVCVAQIADWAGGSGGRVLPGRGGLPLAGWLGSADVVPPVVGLEVFPLEDEGEPQKLADHLVQKTWALLADASERSVV